jgi:hypothetical protein
MAPQIRLQPKSSQHKLTSPITCSLLLLGGTGKIPSIIQHLLLTGSGHERVTQTDGRRSDVMKAHSLYSSLLALLSLTAKAQAIFSSHKY